VVGWSGGGGGERSEVGRCRDKAWRREEGSGWRSEERSRGWVIRTGASAADAHEVSTCCTE
jgi:hypothetical protein